MLTQNHATGAEHSREDEQAARGPERVIVEDVAEGDEQSNQTAHADHVRRYFPAQVDKHRQNLSGDGTGDDTAEEGGGVHLQEEQKTGAVAHQREDIGHVAVLTVRQLPTAPAVQTPEHIDADHRDEHGEGDDDAQHQQLVAHRQQAQVAEKE